jgi:hypothetical protein
MEMSDIMIEVPLDKDRTFMILMNAMLIESGHLIFRRHLFETVGGRKHKLVLQQRYRIIKSKNNNLQPLFVHLPKDTLLHKRAKISKYMDFDEVEAQEMEKIENVRNEVSDFEEDSELDYEDPEACSEHSHFHNEVMDGKWKPPKSNSLEPVKSFMPSQNTSQLAQERLKAREVHLRMMVRQSVAEEDRQDPGSTTRSFIEKQGRNIPISEEESNSDTDSQYSKLIRELSLPPMSRRKNIPLNDNSVDLPHWFN